MPNVVPHVLTEKGMFMYMMYIRTIPGLPPFNHALFGITITTKFSSRNR